MGIYSLFKTASRLVAIYALIIVVAYTWDTMRRIFKKEKHSISALFEDVKLYMQRNGKQRILAPVLSLSFVAYLLTHPTMHQLIGVHNLELKPEGQYCFFVEAQRKSGKTYTLPAQVQVAIEDIYIPSGEGKTEWCKRYYVEKVFFSNGGWLDFQEEDPVDIEDSSFMCAGEDEWRITLLNEHAYSPYVTETNNAGSLDIIQMFADTIPILFLLCACLIPLKKNDPQED